MEAREAHHPGPRWVRAMPFVAAAAVVALLAIIILPALGGDSASDSTGVQALPAAPDARDLRLEVVSTDFDAIRSNPRRRPRRRVSPAPLPNPGERRRRLLPDRRSEDGGSRPFG